MAKELRFLCSLLLCCFLALTLALCGCGAADNGTATGREVTPVSEAAESPAHLSPFSLDYLSRLHLIYEELASQLRQNG